MSLCPTPYLLESSCFLKMGEYIKIAVGGGAGWCDGLRVLNQHSAASEPDFAHACEVGWLHPLWQRCCRPFPGSRHGIPAPKSGTCADHNSVDLRTMERMSLLQPMMAGREVRRMLGADGTGVG